jgi:hypothetical protein
VADSNDRYSDDLRLKAGVSLSQTRFALSNFCLNNFGADGQYFADVIELCVDADRLQEALHTIGAEVRSRCPDRLPALAACVREANETDGETSAPAATAPPSATRLAPQARKPPAQAKRVGNLPPVPVPAVPSRGASPTQRSRGAETDPLRLEAGVSNAQARFALSEFCLDQFGARGQQLVDAIDRCADVTALQKILSRIGADIQERHRDSLPKLIDCVREINETSD